MPTERAPDIAQRSQHLAQVVPRLLPEQAGVPAAAKLWLDADERVLASSHSARRILAANPGAFSLQQGRLRLQPDPSPLQDALRWVCAHGGSPRHERALTVHRVDAAPLTLRISRQHEPTYDEPLAILWLADPELLRLDEAALRQAFDFTPTEARVAVALATGASTTELAAAWGVRANTVQMHVKRLLAKTRTSRQAQLVGLLWRSAVLQLPEPHPRPTGVRACAAPIPTQTGNDGAPP